MEQKRTVRVERVEGHPKALCLRWEQRIVESDIHPAFHEMTKFLDEAGQPVHVIVDLRADPNLPLSTTIFETLRGPFSHHNMGQWLVIAENARAKVIANIISKVGIRDSIHWFNTEDEALEHLTQIEAKPLE
jgi:hypothetical protein